MGTLKTYREQHGITQKAVADHLGIARQTYNKLENNQDSMTIEQANSICKFFRADINEIFFKEKCSGN